MTEYRSTSTEALTVPRCWELLRSDSLGRLAIVVEGEPDVFPVNYVVDHGSIVFRTAAGAKLDAVADRAVVAFEVDGTDRGTAWSVVVKGRAVRIEQPHEIFDATELPLYPWQQDAKPYFVRIEAGEVTGRSFPLPSAPAVDSPPG